MYPSLSSQIKTLGTQLNSLYAPWLLNRACNFLRSYFLRGALWRLRNGPYVSGLCVVRVRGDHVIFEVVGEPCNAWTFWALLLRPCQMEVRMTASCRVRERAQSPWPQFCAWAARDVKGSGPSSWTWGAFDSLRKKGCHSWSLSPTGTTVCCRVAWAWAGLGLRAGPSVPPQPLLSRASPAAVGLSWLKLWASAFVGPF